MAIAAEPTKCEVLVLVVLRQGGLNKRTGCNLASVEKFEFSEFKVRHDIRDTNSFQDILLFSTANYNRFSGTTIPALGGETFQIEGAFTGYLSELTYSRYALSVGEIQTIMQQGPSSKLKQKRMEDPASAYLADDWWSHQVPT
jgi:hypothetical protein